MEHTEGVNCWFHSVDIHCRLVADILAAMLSLFACAARHLSEAICHTCCPINICTLWHVCSLLCSACLLQRLDISKLTSLNHLPTEGQLASLTLLSHFTSVTMSHSWLLHPAAHVPCKSIQASSTTASLFGAVASVIPAQRQFCMLMHVFKSHRVLIMIISLVHVYLLYVLLDTYSCQ